ncbi:nitronate monooxygenase [Mycolicibacterium brumae]|nr:nitronate monooxygenase [Mycolicibacterium brumae]
MAGGPTTPAMVIAAGWAGGLGFLAAGYQTVETMAAAIAEVRASGIPFGVNVFAPTPVPITAERYAQYAALMQREADRFEITLPTVPVDGDDDFDVKLGALLADPVPAVSFTFGLPSAAVITRLRRAGTFVAQTVTSAAEARAAADAGVDCVVAQAYTAGGHSGTFTPDRMPEPLPITDLVTVVSAEVKLPVIAAGGLSTESEVAAALAAGAAAAQLGTALLLAEEAGTSAIHQAALRDPARTETVLTHAFTGRPARALRNRFTDEYTSAAPLGYPALHFLTSPLRKAAAAAGDPELAHLWAGTGHRNIRRGGVGQIFGELSP